MRQPIPFGKYLLLDRISVGGMAEVFRAKSYGVEGFEKVIAIKRILPSMGEDRDFIKMFIDEAKIAGQLAHTNICQIFELGRNDGAHFIAMEFIWGKDLLQIQNRLRKQKRLMPPAMACFVIAKVCDGLDYAHRKRDAMGRPLEIVHRDCSPQNVLISYEGEVKIIDFGIAKAASRSSRTMAGVLKGKFGYMSPEQVRGLPLDRRSDVFALGTILYESLTGERLFQAETDFATLEKVRNVSIAPPRQINPTIPVEVERIILKALSRETEERYQWCSDLHADLQRYLMSQSQVFTAKSLATWLKDGFAVEIERERRQLEDYKRLGRDGLIAGVPHAAAKLDVVQHLGEAGTADDPTMLGGPSFDDLPEEEGNDGSAVAPRPILVPRGKRGEDDGDFAEEAPTEIFGEIGTADLLETAPDTGAEAGGDAAEQGRAAEEAALAIAAMPAPSRRAQEPGPPGARAARAASEPRVIVRQTGQSSIVGGGGSAAAGATASASGGASGTAARLGKASSDSPTVDRSVGRRTSQAPAVAPPPARAPARASVAPQIPSVPAMPAVLGAPAPFAGGSAGYPVAPANDESPMFGGPAAAAAAAAAPVFTPPATLQAARDASPPPGPLHAPAGPRYDRFGTTQQVSPLPAPAIATAIDPARRRPSLGKDILIGVGIAVVVVGLFAAGKHFLFGDRGGPRTAETAATGTLVVTVPDPQPADVIVNGTKQGIVEGGGFTLERVVAGDYTVRVERPGAAPCEQSLHLAAGKVETIKCSFARGPGNVVLDGLAPDHVVLLAGAPLPPEAARAPIPVAPDQDHRLQVKRGDVVIQELTVRAAAGATVRYLVSDIAEPAPLAAVDSGADQAEPAEAAAPPASATVEPILTAPPAPPSGPADSTAAEPTPPSPPAPAASAPARPARPARIAKPRPASPADPGTADSATAAADLGFLAAETTPAARVIVDGVDTGKTTPLGDSDKLPLKAGKHKVTFAVGKDKFSYTIHVEAGKEIKLTKELPVSPATN